jgi:hypothetical protein
MMKLMKITGAILVAGLTACGSAGSAESENVSKSATEALTMTSSSYFSQVGSDIAAISRGTSLLDILRIEAGSVKLLRWDGTTYQPDQLLGSPSGVTLRTLTAVSNATRIDVFAVGSDHHVWHNSSTATTGAPTFSGWTADIPGNPTVLTDSSVAVTSTGAGQLHVFWSTPSKNIGHAWYIGNVPQSWESGDTASKTWFQPPTGFGQSDISAVSTAPGVIHVFYPDNSGSLTHFWFDGVSWGTTNSPNRERWSTFLQTSTPISGGSVSVMSTGANNIEVFIRAIPTAGAGTLTYDIYHTSFNGSWFTFPFGGVTALDFDIVNHSGTTAPLSLGTAIQWNTPTSRLDLYGSGRVGLDTQIWQAVR